MTKLKLLTLISSLFITTNILSACNNGYNTENISNKKTTETNKPNVKYESPEHYLLANSIKLKYPHGEESGGSSVLLNINLDKANIKQEQKLSFAQIVYLAGDFMGDPNTQIGGNDKEQMKRNFMTNFNVMTDTDAKYYLPSIIEIVNEELEHNKDKITNHEALDISSEDNIKFNCATGGGCNKLTWLVNYGLYMKLASKNYDHFGQNAVDTYLAGHEIALLMAKTARDEHNPEKLRLAYAYEAYADHFLTDLFASGHLRTLRKEIVNWCYYTPPDVSSYLTKVMHDEDNKNGLWMTNMKGERWKTYGDNHLFINDNSDSMKKAVEVMQSSANQIFEVYNGINNIEYSMQLAKQELPNFEAINSDPENKPALFKQDGYGRIYEYDNGRYVSLNACLVRAVYYGYKSL